MSQLFKSSVTWTLVVAFVVGGLQALTPLVGPTWSAVISGVITVVGLVFHNGQIKAGSAKVS